MSNLLIVNFGGPRSLAEIPEFLRALLLDRDVIWSRLPAPLHRLLFSRIANKRAHQIIHDYELIGSKSPIFEDTEWLAEKLREKHRGRVITFHRYLPSTHADSFKKIAELGDGPIHVFPLFPQFCYATTGSIARFFLDNLPFQIVRQMEWVASYASHPAYIAAMAQRIRQFLHDSHLDEAEIALLFSAHGVPEEFISNGDMYEKECRRSYDLIRKGFPAARHLLAYQSKFGPGEWIKPYTSAVCDDILSLSGERKKIVVVPLTFTSDHIETLFEIEKLYLPAIRKQDLEAYRCPALNREPYWVDAIDEICQTSARIATQMLVRPKLKLRAASAHL